MTTPSSHPTHPRPAPEPQPARPEADRPSKSPPTVPTQLDTHTRFLVREELGLPPAPPRSV